MKKIFLTLYTLLVIVTAGFSLATEPAAQPTGMQFASIEPYSLVMSFTATSADGYLVLKSDMPITDVPVDGMTYEKGQGLTTCKVMYVGGSNSFSVREILENTKYYFMVFAYNGSAAQTNYLQTNPFKRTNGCR